MNLPKKHILIIGAGMAGLTAAIKLLEKGLPVTMIEAENELGGLARNFKIDNKYFPIGYHHILAGDKPLLKMLTDMGMIDEVVWKKIKIMFAIDNQTYNLVSPIDFYKFPLSLINKFRFALLMGYCILKRNWTSDLGNAHDWIDKIAGVNVRETVFDPLVDIKYGLPSKYLSANWLGSRLHYQEFSRPLGYLVNDEWTKVLIEKMHKKITDLGGIIITNAYATKIEIKEGQFRGLFFSKDKQEQYLPGDALVNTAPPHIFTTLLDCHDENLKKIEYLDAISLIMEINEHLPREFYLLSCLKPRYSFGGIYALSSLKSNIGVKGETVINFFSTLSESSEHLRHKSVEELTEIYLNDFNSIFGFQPKPIWSKLNLIKNYSPKYLNNYKNPLPYYAPGIYLAGNYLTYPDITSTGSAIASGEKATNCIIEQYAR